MFRYGCIGIQFVRHFKWMFQAFPFRQSSKRTKTKQNDHGKEQELKHFHSKTNPKKGKKREEDE